MASVEQFEKQQEEARGFRKDWAYQPGSEGWNKLVKEIANAGTQSALLNFLRGSKERPEETAIELQQKVIILQVTLAVMIESLILSSEGPRNKELMEAMMAECSLLTSEAIEEAKKHIREQKVKRG